MIWNFYGFLIQKNSHTSPNAYGDHALIMQLLSVAKRDQTSTMAEIVSPTPIHSIARVSHATDQQRGSFKGSQIRGGIVQDATIDLNFDMGQSNVLISQKAGEKMRKAVLLDKATQMRQAIGKSVAQRLSDFEEEYGAAFRSFMSELKTLQKRGRKPTFSDLRDLADEYFDDPSIRHAAITAAAQMEEQMGDQDGLADLLHQFAQTLMEEEGPSIRAGYNINPIIELFAGGTSDTFRALRDAYRETLLSDASEEQIYEFLVHVLPLRLRHVLRRQRQNEKDKKKREKPAWEDWDSTEKSE
ncbi:MAG: hypothetical protein C5B47_00335 [Verrucomicrobia bacterium]|nr:MAG: hypothetical protein C5B47_00335 [Verrucomicrobiota bacterium]